MKKSTDQSDYLKDLADYQNHKYLPGYYTGGNLPPGIKYASRKTGWLFLILLFPFAVISLVTTLTSGISFTSLASLGWGGVGSLFS